VVRETNEVRGPGASYYEGIYTIVLNQTVDVAMVPDVSRAAPPWDARAVPADRDLVSTVEQARIDILLSSSYAVTPNPALAGRVERTESDRRVTDAAGAAPIPEDQRRGWVRYVSAAEFDRFADELPRLYEVVLGQHSGALVSGLLGFEVMRFVTEQIVAAPWLHPYDAKMLGRTGVATR
jgi:hypothetical protein